MRSWLIVLVLLVSAAAQAAKPPKAKKPKLAVPKVEQAARPFADVPVSSMTVVDVRGEQAAVSNKEGSIVLVRVGDTLGLEEVSVERIGGGCLALKAEKTGAFSLCVDAPEVPRS